MMDSTNNRWNDVIGITLAGLVVTAGLVGCEQKPTGDAQKEAPAAETKSEPAGEAMEDAASAAGEAVEDATSAAGEAVEDATSAAGEAVEDATSAADEAE